MPGSKPISDSAMRVRLLERSIINTTTGCREWQRCRSPKGYGQLGFRGRQMHAHRASYEVFIGPIPAGLWVLHKCDNPPCINPEHLFLGTNADNVADKVAKGRATAPTGDAHYSRTNPERLARGDRHGSKLHPERWRRGETHGSAKLTETDVRAILASTDSCKSLGRFYGVSDVLISLIRRRKAWRHISEAP